MTLGGLPASSTSLNWCAARGSILSRSRSGGIEFCRMALNGVVAFEPFSLQSGGVKYILNI
jgi:hypothetical protein